MSCKVGSDQADPDLPKSLSEASVAGNVINSTGLLHRDQGPPRVSPSVSSAHPCPHELHARQTQDIPRGQKGEAWSCNRSCMTVSGRSISGPGMSTRSGHHCSSGLMQV